MAGIYPSYRQAASMVSLQAQPHSYPYPPMGDPPPLIWKVDKVENGYAAVGRSLEELKAL